MEGIESIYPILPLQQGMLSHSLYAPESGVYVQQLICELHHALDASALERAWQRVVERHAVLRTGFIWEGVQEPLQEVRRQIQLPFETHDLRGSPATEQAHRLDAFLDADRRRGFDLTKAPLMRLALFRLEEDDYRLVWTSHHALMDGRSRLLVIKDAFAFYEASVRGVELELPRARPFREYVEWQRGQNLAGAEKFWRRLLQGFDAPTDLALPKPQARAGIADWHGEVNFTLPSTETAALLSAAQRYGVTLNTIVQGCWAVLLSRYSGAKDVVFGATRAGRRTALGGDAASVVGLLINTLPVRARVMPETPLPELLKALWEQNVAVRDFEHTPLRKVQAESEVEGGAPLFESIIVFDNYKLNSALKALGGEWTQRDFTLLERTNYPLTISVYADLAEPSLTLKFAFDRERFEETAVRRLAGHFRTVLECIAVEPGRRIAELSWMTEAETRQVLVEWNNTGEAFDLERCAHELFEAQAARLPSEVALIFNDQLETYGELNRRANQLAHYLRRIGVGPEVIVGIMLDHSVEMVTALLGILKAGGAYLPFDPANPQERLSFIAADARVSLILTRKGWEKFLPQGDAKVVYIDAEPEILRESPENPGGAVRSENLAYVIYTSGSTGRPKGVQVTHRSLVNFLESMRLQPGLGAQDLLLAITTLSFDIAALELYLPLITGARLKLIGREAASDGVELAKRLAEVTVAQATPTTWRLLLESGWTGSERLKILCGGEALNRDLANLLLDRSVSLWNLYGPTETTIWSSIHEVGRQEGSVPIGRPLANTRLYVLGAEREPLPVGVAGELYIGGEGLARGYLKRPALTAERFIPDPFSTAPGTRMYRTGDLARFREDGQVEFLGRLDQQVKIRGFRIELGEIEAALTEHADVRECAVVAREDTPGDGRLAAYVVASEGRAPAVSELRAHLRARLPEYMVPSAYMLLGALPVTPNGKLDRRALPKPGQELNETASGDYVAPRTDIERIMAAVWAEVLGSRRIGASDNFLNLGGHSLKAAQVISRIRERFQVELPLRSVFEVPTLAEFATLFEQRLIEQLEGLTEEQARQLLEE